MRRLGGLLLVLLLLAAPAAAQAPTPAPGSILTPLREFTQGALSLLAFSVVPDSAGSAIQLDSGGTSGTDDIRARLGQLGSGFTWSEEFPLYLEGYLGYARYDPRFLLSDGTEERRVPTRWNHLSVTVGMGWDFRIAPNLYLRPVLNASLAHITSDLAVAGFLVQRQTGADLGFLDRGRLNAWGLGGALVLAWYDHRPEREIDLELRVNQLHLSTFGGTTREVRGETEARTATAWFRYRWPTGTEMLQRPLRWVFEANHTQFLGSQREVLGFQHLTKLGGGIELDVGALGIGPSWLEWQRLRLMGRYLFGDNVQGFSLGLGFSF